MSERDGLRRFADRILAGACALVLTLVGLVWAITWNRTTSDLEATQREVRKLDESKEDIDRRVTTLEAQQQENSRIFQRIENRQHATEAKIDKLGEKIDQILRELRR